MLSGLSTDCPARPRLRGADRGGEAMPDDIYALPGQPLAVEQPENPFPDSYLGIRDLPEDLIEAHSQLVESLQAQGDQRSAGAARTDVTNVVGVGIGLSGP